MDKYAIIIKNKNHEYYEDYQGKGASYLLVMFASPKFFSPEMDSVLRRI